MSVYCEVGTDICRLNDPVCIYIYTYWVCNDAVSFRNLLLLVLFVVVVVVVVLLAVAVVMVVITRMQSGPSVVKIFERVPAVPTFR